MNKNTINRISRPQGLPQSSITFSYSVLRYSNKFCNCTNEFVKLEPLCEALKQTQAMNEKNTKSVIIKIMKTPAQYCKSRTTGGDKNFFFFFFFFFFASSGPGNQPYQLKVNITWKLTFSKLG